MEIQPIKQEQDHISDLYLNLNSKSTPHKLKHKHIAPSALSPHSNPNSLSLYGNPDLSLLQGNNNINNQFPPNFNYYDSYYHLYDVHYLHVSLCYYFQRIFSFDIDSYSDFFYFGYSYFTYN